MSAGKCFGISRIDWSRAKAFPFLQKGHNEDGFGCRSRTVLLNDFKDLSFDTYVFMPSLIGKMCYLVFINTEQFIPLHLNEVLKIHSSSVYLHFSADEIIIFY